MTILDGLAVDQFTSGAKSGRYCGDKLKVVKDGLDPITVTYKGLGAYSGYQVSIKFDDDLEAKTLRTKVLSRICSNSAAFRVSSVVSVLQAYTAPDC